MCASSENVDECAKLDPKRVCVCREIGGDMMSMREHMSAQMMRGGLHDGKMQHSYGAGMMMNLGGRMLKSQQGDSFAFQDSLMGVGTRFCVCVCVCVCKI